VPSVFIEPLSVPMRPPSDGVVVVLGVVVDVVPPLELMLPELGAVVSDELGAAVLGDVVLGDVALGDVVLGDVALGEVVLGDVVLGVVVLVESLLGGAAVPGVAVLGDCVPGAVELGELLLEPVPLVCAYTRPAATASATLVLAAMYLNLLIDNSCLEVDETKPVCPGFGHPFRGNRHAHRLRPRCAADGFNVFAWAARPRVRRWQIPSGGCTGSSS
jgi:hypothetical protein